MKFITAAEAKKISKTAYDMNSGKSYDQLMAQLNLEIRTKSELMYENATERQLTAHYFTTPTIADQIENDLQENGYKTDTVRVNVPNNPNLICVDLRIIW